MTDTQFQNMLQQGIKARANLLLSTFGSKKGEAAERRIERLCERAEKAGRLQEFCKALNAIEIIDFGGGEWGWR